MRIYARLASALILASAITSIAGCGTTTEYVPVPPEPIEIPVRPELPTIGGQALNCVPDDAYMDLVARDVMLQSHIQRLEALLRTTHEQDEGDE